MIAAAALLLLWMGQAQEQSATSVRTEAVSEDNFRISGTLVDAISGKPLASAQVMINGPDSQITLTAEDGRFIFENVDAGKYALSAERKGYPQAFYKQHEQFSTAIITGPGLNTENLRFALRPGASISGEVMDEAGEAVRGARVLLLRRDIAGGRRSTFEQNEMATNDLGHYRFGDVTPGTYFVAVSATPWYAQHGLYTFTTHGPQRGDHFTPGEPELDVVYPITFFSNATELANAAAITVRAGDSQVADVRLQAIPGLRLTVHTAASSDGENVFAKASQPIGEDSQIKLDFQVGSQEIAPGVLEIRGLPPGRINLMITSNKGSESREQRETLVLTGNSEITVDSGKPDVGVSGSVEFEDGSAAPAGLGFQLRSKEGALYGMRTESNGAFEVNQQKVPPGKYDLWLMRQGQQTTLGVKSVSATNATVKGRTVEIGSGGDVKLRVVLWRGTGDVSGFAVREGKGVDGVMVMLVPEVPGSNLIRFRQDQSDSDGSFAIAAVGPGRYTVVAIENGWDMEWSTPEVLKRYLPGGQRVEITPGTKVEVKVKVQ